MIAGSSISEICAKCKHFYENFQSSCQNFYRGKADMVGRHHPVPGLFPLALEAAAQSGAVDRPAQQTLTEYFSRSSRSPGRNRRRTWGDSAGTHIFPAPQLPSGCLQPAHLRSMIFRSCWSRSPPQRTSPGAADGGVIAVEPAVIVQDLNGGHAPLGKSGFGSGGGAPPVVVVALEDDLLPREPVDEQKNLRAFPDSWPSSDRRR